MEINYSLRPWEICCIVFLLIWIFGNLAVIKWINYEKKINQHLRDSNHGYRIGPSNGNKTKEEKELFERLVIRD